eukprot:c21540_g1_i1.p1 GENE.c21540_g1_i1~~c21540_g1_i1.p1  ORF type:complete len:100 (-),score=22.36 c21540_g1_i1:155-454(-)
MSRARHRQNAGLCVSLEKPSQKDLDDVTNVVDVYSGSVSVWAGVSWWGKLPIDITFDKQDQDHDVIKARVKPFMSAHPEAQIFQQDGAGPHKGKKQSLA